MNPRLRATEQDKNKKLKEKILKGTGENRELLNIVEKDIYLSLITTGDHKSFITENTEGQDQEQKEHRKGKKTTDITKNMQGH